MRKFGLFFMYCNGAYWNTVSLGDKLSAGFINTEVPAVRSKMLTDNPTPAYLQLKAHARELTNDEFYAFLKPAFNKIDAIKTFEDAYRVAI